MARSIGTSGKARPNQSKVAAPDYQICWGRSQCPGAPPVIAEPGSRSNTRAVYDNSFWSARSAAPLAPRAAKRGLATAPRPYPLNCLLQPQALGRPRRLSPGHPLGRRCLRLLPDLHTRRARRGPALRGGARPDPRAPAGAAAR